MGLTIDELRDLQIEATLELARALGVPTESWPALSRLAAFDKEVKEGRRIEAERSLREHEQKQHDEQVRFQQLKAEHDAHEAANAARVARGQRPLRQFVRVY